MPSNIYSARKCRWILGARWILYRNGLPIGKISAAHVDEVLERLNAPRWQARHPASARCLKTHSPTY